jgi:branched-subunit amino acid aminotransferase/4-amino-4-deoxychorismate lyase
MSFIFVNGQLVPASEASISVQDRGFRFGDGVFETIAVYQGVPYQFEFHLQRLKGGLDALKIPFDTDTLATHVKSLLHANQIDSATLRIQITRGIGSKGYLPDANHPQAGSSCVIETMPRPEAQPDGITLWVSKYQKTFPLALPTQFKLCQGLNSTLARMDAVENGGFDGLQLTEDGYICETSSANVFWLKHNTLYTPPVECGALAGSTRAAVIRLSPYPVKEVMAKLSDLADAQAVCITNSAWHALGVATLAPKSYHWESSDLALQLRVLLSKDILNYCQTHKGQWL